MALKADGFDDALIGIGTQFNKTLAVYDWDKCIEVLMKRDGMTYEDAVTYMDFNVTDAYVGPETPVFIQKHLNFSDWDES